MEKSVRPRARSLLALALLTAATALGGCLEDRQGPPQRTERPPPSAPAPAEERPLAPKDEEERVPDLAEESARRAVVWAIGDGADGSAKARRLAQMIGSRRVDRLLYLGDVYERGTAEEFAENYEPVYGDLAEVTSPTPGNHDWPNHEQGYDRYWQRVHGRRPRPYYSFSLGGWKILSLNSEESTGRESPQVRWLERQLHRGEGTCRLAFWHQARYSAGTKHGDEPDVDPFWDALSGQAAVVVSGHEHNSQRFEPRDGIVQLVAGAGRGSEPLYRLREDSRLAFGNDQELAALRLELRPGRAEYDFVTAAGRKLDSGEVRCESGG